MSVEILTINGTVIKTNWGRFYLVPVPKKEGPFIVKVINAKGDIEEYEVSRETFEEIHSAIGRKMS